MSANISPLQLIRNAPAGSTMYSRIEFDESGNRETGFLIREESSIVQRLGEHPRVELRAGLFEEQGVALVAVLLRVGEEYYETWWNYHQTGGGEQYFRDMTTQARIPILFYTNRIERSIAINNSLAPFFADVTPRAATLPAWTMQQFDAARERIYARFPTPTKLWNQLRRIK